MTFTEAYTHYYSFVLKICRTILEDGDTAKDATQETMFKLMMNWDALDERESLQAWLRKAAHNTCIDMIRKRNREQAFAETRKKEYTEADIGKELLADAKEIVRTFPEKYQEVFRLAFLRGLTGQQIANRLGIPLSTVKTRTRACLKLLSDALA